MTENQDPGAKRWIDEAEEALSRTGDAIRAAWESTREARMSTLEAAKEAASRLAKTIDQGIEAARETWEPSRDDDPAPGGDSSDEEQ